MTSPMEELKKAQAEMLAAAEEYHKAYDAEREASRHATAAMNDLHTAKARLDTAKKNFDEAFVKVKR